MNAEDTGIWNEVQRYLCKLVERDGVSFRRVFEQLTETSASTLLGFFRQPRCFDLLLHQLQEADVAEMVGQLAMSSNTATRRLGLFLFEKLELNSLPDASFSANGSLGMRLLFYEVQRTNYDPQAFARLSVSLLRQVDLLDPEFTNEVAEELKLQSRNFAGKCRSELQERGGDIAEVVNVLKSVEFDFQRLKAAHEAGINAMEVAGHRQAARLHRRWFSQQVSEGAKKYSNILGMVKQVRVLYGESVSTYINGDLQNSLRLIASSSSMEIPVIDYCDPEAMALRRNYANRAIRNLLDREREAKEENE